MKETHTPTQRRKDKRVWIWMKSIDYAPTRTHTINFFCLHPNQLGLAQPTTTSPHPSPSPFPFPLVLLVLTCVAVFVWHDCTVTDMCLLVCGTGQMCASQRCAQHD